jgi:hypothetical protein
MLLRRRRAVLERGEAEAGSEDCCSEGGGEREGQTAWAKRSEGNAKPSEPSDGKMESERSGRAARSRTVRDSKRARTEAQRERKRTNEQERHERNKRARLAGNDQQGGNQVRLHLLPLALMLLPSSRPNWIRSS